MYYLNPNENKKSGELSIAESTVIDSVNRALSIFKIMKTFEMTRPFPKVPRRIQT